MMGKREGYAQEIPPGNSAPEEQEERENWRQSLFCLLYTSRCV